MADAGAATEAAAAEAAAGGGACGGGGSDGGDGAGGGGSRFWVSAACERGASMLHAIDDMGAAEGGNRGSAHLIEEAAERLGLRCVAPHVASTAAPPDCVCVRASEQAAPQTAPRRRLRDGGGAALGRRRRREPSRGRRQPCCRRRRPRRALARLWPRRLDAHRRSRQPLLPDITSTLRRRPSSCPSPTRPPRPQAHFSTRGGRGCGAEGSC